MSDIVIRVENLSKRYRIGLKEEMHDTFAEAMMDFVRRPLKNMRRLRRLTRFSEDGHDPEDIIWALKDVSFEVKRGEVVGIIGRNGAGKSTLLKILSHITHPTSGRVELRGRVSSLLEVGTGFHSELTGRENVYLNGTILGMTKAEVDRKFDEIVDFSGVEKFIDTPVKRYSSGMKVRLAFSVAAHLEPDILIVDEVLAVGDMAFRKKCLKKISQMRDHTKAILLVSHNMISVRAICSRVMLLSQGKVLASGDTEMVVSLYEKLMLENAAQDNVSDEQEEGMGKIKISTVMLMDEQGRDKSLFETGEKIKVVIEYIAVQKVENPVVYAAIRRPDGFICVGSSTKLEEVSLPSLYGSGRIEIEIPKLLVVPGYYVMDVTFYDHNFEFRTYFLGRKRVSFQVNSTHHGLDDKYGVFYQKPNWKIIE